MSLRTVHLGKTPITFVGDTGYGKLVAAERLVYETTLRWQLRTIVLDFGAGWRKLLNAPGLEGRVEIRQLSPGGVRPLRWNPLQIGRYILPEVQWRAFCDIFGAIAKLGVRRQVIVFEEANKILAGLDNAGSDEESGGTSTAEQFANMWRDSRKYGIWLHSRYNHSGGLPHGHSGHLCRGRCPTT